MASQKDEAVVVKVGTKQFRRPAVHSAQQFGVDPKPNVQKASRKSAEASPGSAATNGKSQTGANAAHKKARQAAAGSPGQGAKATATGGDISAAATTSTSVPKVVCIRVAELRKRGINSFEEWKALPSSLYIGRNNAYVKGTFNSPWRNPFPVKKLGRQGCIDAFEEKLRASTELLEQLPDLAGKELGCWCAPEACHGDVLVKVFREQVAAGGK